MTRKEEAALPGGVRIEGGRGESSSESTFPAWISFMPFFGSVRDGPVSKPRSVAILTFSETTVSASVASTSNFSPLTVLTVTRESPPPPLSTIDHDKRVPAVAESLCPPLLILVHFLLPPMSLVHSGGVLSHGQMHTEASRSNRNCSALCPNSIM
jgi:hypothetical protein